MATNIAEHFGSDALSAREIEVLRLIAAGNPNKLIAHQLAIAEETVKGHVKICFQNLVPVTARTPLPSA